MCRCRSRQRPSKSEHAALALIRQLCAQPGEITVLATGPLTNLALAERLRPGVLKEARQIIVMGGSLESGAPKLGNTTPRAEFNAYADPHAFDVVLKAGANLSLLGLNLTRQVQVTRERARQLAAVGTAAASPAPRCSTITSTVSASWVRRWAHCTTPARRR